MPALDDKRVASSSQSPLFVEQPIASVWGVRYYLTVLHGCTRPFLPPTCLQRKGETKNRPGRCLTTLPGLFVLGLSICNISDSNE